MAQPEQQVFSEVQVEYGNITKLSWSWSGDNSVVPPNKILEITTLTLNYFPSEGGTVGRADIAGRNSSGNAVWRLQVVYVHPKQTMHLPFPKALRLEAGGHVELAFVVEGPGTIFMSANGTLLDK